MAVPSTVDLNNYNISVSTLTDFINLGVKKIDIINVSQEDLHFLKSAVAFYGSYGDEIKELKDIVKLLQNDMLLLVRGI